MRMDTTRRLLLAPVAAALTSLALAGPALAADGDLDTTFGTAGLTTVHPLAGAQSTAHDVVVDAKGRTVMVGGTRQTGEYAFAVARLDAAGDPDTSFSGDGTARTVVGDGGTARTIALDGTGYLVGGDASSDVSTLPQFALVRYTEDGEPDTGFSGDGVATAGVGDWPGATGLGGGVNDIARLADGDIVAAGYGIFAGFGGSSRMHAVVARFNADGSLDTAFGGGDGVADVLMAPFGSAAKAVVVQPDGSIVVGGIGYNSAANHPALARFTPQGELDKTFGEEGVAQHNPMQTGFSEFVEADLRDLAVDGQGRIVGAGMNRGNDANDAEFALMRWSEDGALDATFGDDRLVARARTGGWSEANDVEVLADGSILAAGLSGDGEAFALARFTADGDHLTAFGGGDGWVTQAVGTAAVAHGMVADAAGARVTVAGLGDDGFTAMRHEITPLGGSAVDEPVDDKDEQVPPVKDELRDEKQGEPAVKLAVAAPAVVPPVEPKVAPRATVTPRRCSSRRLFTLTPRKLGLRGAKVVANGRTGRRAVIERKGGSVTIDLRRLPAGTYSVQVRGRTPSGARRSITKTYRTCA